MNNICDLTDRHCVPCEGGVPTLSREEAEVLLADVPGWELADDAKLIVRRCGSTSDNQQPALQQALHVSTTIETAQNNNLICDHFVNKPVRLEKYLAKALHAMHMQLRRVMPTLGLLVQAQYQRFQLIKRVISVIN